MVSQSDFNLAQKLRSSPRHGGVDFGAPIADEDLITVRGFDGNVKPPCRGKHPSTGFA